MTHSFPVPFARGRDDGLDLPLESSLSSRELFALPPYPSAFPMTSRTAYQPRGVEVPL